MHNNDHNEIKDPSDTLNAERHSNERMMVRGKALMAQVKNLLHEGNVRRIAVMNPDGHTVIEIPVTAGLVATVVAPALTAIAALGALASDWQIEVHRDDDRAVPATAPCLSVSRVCFPPSLPP